MNATANATLGALPTYCFVNVPDEVSVRIVPVAVLSSVALDVDIRDMPSAAA
ncbi:MAG TPA: hypothetical protein VMI75_18330 [Polyangiaceae bacterium]|nr:hypothetical protein [Polyangiaceae bacterium]